MTLPVFDCICAEFVVCWQMVTRNISKIFSKKCFLLSVLTYSIVDRL